MLKEIFARKIGMTQVFDGAGNLIGVTLIEVEPVRVLEKVASRAKLKARIGCFRVKAGRKSKVKKPNLGYFNKLKTEPYKLIKEVDAEENLEEKSLVGIEIFNEGERIDVRAKTKGKGFAGGMRKYGWHGGPKSHGSTTHRRIGSVGACTFPGRIVKGHHMPGHMGNKYSTAKNLKILKVDKEKNILFVKGSIQGSRGNVLKIKKVK